MREDYDDCTWRGRWQRTFQPQSMSQRNVILPERERASVVLISSQELRGDLIAGQPEQQYMFAQSLVGEECAQLCGHGAPTDILDYI